MVSEARQALSRSLLRCSLSSLFPDDSGTLAEEFLLHSILEHVASALYVFFIDVTCVKLDTFRICGTTYDTYIYNIKESPVSIARRRLAHARPDELGAQLCSLHSIPVTVCVLTTKYFVPTWFI